MANDLNLYEIDFKPMWPVPYGLIVLARTPEDAMDIARKTITHTEPTSVKPITADKPGVVFYRSGNY